MAASQDEYAKAKDRLGRAQEAAQQKQQAHAAATKAEEDRLAKGAENSHATTAKSSGPSPMGARVRISGHDHQMTPEQLQHWMFLIAACPVRGIRVTAEDHHAKPPPSSF